MSTGKKKHKFPRCTVLENFWGKLRNTYHIYKQFMTLRVPEMKKASCYCFVSCIIIPNNFFTCPQEKNINSTDVSSREIIGEDTKYHIYKQFMTLRVLEIKKGSCFCFVLCIIICNQ